MLSWVVAYSRVIESIKRYGHRLQDVVFSVPARILFRCTVSPDFVSVLSMAFVFLSSLFLFWGNRYYLATLMIAVCLDMLDGTLARMYGKNPLGGLFDYFSDRFSDSMLLLAFVASGMLDYYLALLLLFFYVVSTLLSKTLESRGVKVYLLSFRILTVLALFLQEAYPRALFWVSVLLLLNYSLVALSAIPAAMKKPSPS